MKNKARIIIPVWGHRYLKKLFDLTLPALLAPGNLPALAREFDCELVLVTEDRAVDWIKQNPVYTRLTQHCTVSTRSVDDLLVGHWYGISLTKALCRGFADLGEAMVETYLFFLNADFVLADGSYESVIKRIKDGATVINAPSYCVIEEDVYDDLLSRRTDDGASLAVSPRDLARMTIDHRHYTIRAKTLNQKVYRMHRQDQFYWYVDANTMIGRQMPVSLICMRPEVVRQDLGCYWDYGVVEELAPSYDYCVIGDSDDFLMMELRRESTFEEHLYLGVFSPEEIADDLGKTYPKNHFEMGHFDLCLHAEDVPPEAKDAKQALDAYMADLYALLPKHPVSHLGHAFWRDPADNFESLRQEFLAAEIKADHTSGDETAAVPDATQPSGGVGFFRQLAANTYYGIFGRLPFVTVLHPYCAPFSEIMNVAVPYVNDPDNNILIVSNINSGPVESYIRANTSNHYCLLIPEDDNDVPDESFCPYGQVDYCFINLEMKNLVRAKEVFKFIRPFLGSSAEVMIFSLWQGGNPLKLGDAAHLRNSFPIEGRARTIFFGGRLLLSSLKAFRAAESLRRRKRPLGLIASVGALLYGAVFAWLARPLSVSPYCNHFVEPGVGILMHITLDEGGDFG